MEFRIKPQKNFSIDDIKEIWQHKELLYFFTWRELKVRYKQTAIGVMWVLFQPFVTMVVFSVVFGHFGKIPSGNVPYPIFVYVGLLIWQFFSSSLAGASNSLIGNAGIITKVYFPRLILPIVYSLVSLVDFAIASIILFGLMVYYHVLPHVFGLVILPLLLAISFLISVGGGMILAAINVKYRDVRYALPFFLQILLFVTPVIYPPDILNKYSWVLVLNPMTGVLKAARATILGTAPVDWSLLIFSGIGGVILFVLGILYFNKTERFFADIV